MNLDLLDKQFEVLLTRWAGIPLPDSYVDSLRAGFKWKINTLDVTLYDPTLLISYNPEIFELIEEELDFYTDLFEVN